MKTLRTENYYGELLELGEKIATQYHNKDAWHATLYSNYNEDSSFGLSLAAEPEAVPFLLELASDTRCFYEGRGARLLAEALARRYTPGSPNCSAVLAKKQQIKTLVRERVASKVEGLDGSAILALGVCGTKDDIAFMKERYRKVETEGAADKRAAQNKESVLWLLNNSIKKIEDRETQLGFPLDAH